MQIVAADGGKWGRGHEHWPVQGASGLVVVICWLRSGYVVQVVVCEAVGIDQGLDINEADMVPRSHLL